MQTMRRTLKKFALGGLLLLSMLLGTGNVYARSLELQPIQVQKTGYTDSQGMITVVATCPQHFHVQSGSAQITNYTQDRTPVYTVLFNGPDANGLSWKTTVETTNGINVTVVATCVATAG